MKNKKTIRSLIFAIPIVVLIIVVMALLPSSPASDAEETFAEGDQQQDNNQHTNGEADQDPSEDDDQEYDPEDELYEPYEPWEDPRPRALLTGLPIDDEYLYRRPLAVVINNIHVALPQSGVAYADVIYEVLSEGNITRLIAIFQSNIPEKIGPVRSTRDYFVDMAFNHDAIFIHHGGSQSGYARIRNTGVPNLDGMQLEPVVFWRDRSYPDWHTNSGLRPIEHSSYTSWQRVEAHINARSIRNTVSQNPGMGFYFGNRDYVQPFQAASQVTVPFSPTYVRSFTFNPETGLYYVENMQGPHMDAVTASQVAVANVLVQQVTMRVIDNEGRREVGTVGSGSGYLATGGNVYRVTWSKASHTAPMRWYFEDGTPLALTPGTTWVNVFQTTGSVTFE